MTKIMIRPKYTRPIMAVVTLEDGYEIHGSIGYLGTGPTRTAFEILKHYLRHEEDGDEIAEDLKGLFKQEFVSKWDPKKAQTIEIDLNAWIGKQIDDMLEI